jgi:hypothetical protein
VDVRASPLRKGDILVVATSVAHQDLQTQPVLSRIGGEEQTKPLLNLVCAARPMRLYASGSTLGPWSLSRQCVARIDVYRVEQDAHAP